MMLRAILRGNWFFVTSLCNSLSREHGRYKGDVRRMSMSMELSGIIATAEQRGALSSQHTTIG